MPLLHYKFCRINSISYNSAIIQDESVKVESQIILTNLTKWLIILESLKSSSGDDTTNTITSSSDDD